MVIPIVTGALGTLTKGCVKGPENLEIRLDDTGCHSDHQLTLVWKLSKTNNNNVHYLHQIQTFIYTYTWADFMELGFKS